MKICLSSPLLFAYRMEDVFRIAHSLGYEGVEVWHFHLLKTGEDPQKLRKLARELGLTLSVHALSWDLNFTSKLERVREASLEMLEESIALTQILEANPVVFHPGRITIPGDGEEDYWGLLVNGVRRLCAYGQPRGVDLALEIMEHIPKEFFINPEDSARIIKEVSMPNLGITFDAAHVPLELDPLEFLRQVSGVRHVHISDLTPEKRHIALGTGVRDFGPLVKYIRDKLQVDVAIEGMEYKQDTWLASHNKREMDRLANSN